MEIVEEGSISTETQIMLELLGGKGGDGKNRHLTQLQREVIGFYSTSLMRIDQAQQQLLFRSTDGRMRTDLSLSILRRKNVQANDNQDTHSLTSSPVL